MDWIWLATIICLYLLYTQLNTLDYPTPNIPNPQSQPFPTPPPPPSPSQPTSPPSHPVTIQFSLQAVGGTLFSDLKLNLQSNIITMIEHPHLDLKDIASQPIGKYTIDHKLRLSIRRRPVTIKIMRDDKVLTSFDEFPQRIFGECVSEYHQMYNLKLLSGTKKGENVDKAMLAKPLSELAQKYQLKIGLEKKRVMISKDANHQVFITSQVKKTQDSIEFPSVYEVETKDGKKTQKNLEEDVENLMKNVVDLIQTQSSGDAVKTVLESYQRSVKNIDHVASQKLQQKLKHTKSGPFQHSPLYILGQTLKNQGANITYSQKQTAASVFSMLHLSTMFGQNYNKAVYQVDQGQYTFDSIKDNQLKRQEFIRKFKKDMAEQYGTTEDNILVKGITRGSINVEFYCGNAGKEFSNSTKTHLKGRLLKEERLFEVLNLSQGHFDQRGNIDFTRIAAEEQIRGGLPYYQPSGWIRYGLNVKKWTEKDSGWLAMDGNEGEWAVMYHGVSRNLAKAVRSIADSTLKPGGAQACEGHTPIITKSIYKILEKKANRQKKTIKGALKQYLEKTTVTYQGFDNSIVTNQIQANSLGKGVYGSPLIEICSSGYCNEKAKVDQDEYIIAFQCRVRPESVRISSIVNTYWVIRDPEDIRPYGLLISKKETQNEKFHLDMHAKFDKSYKKSVTDVVDITKIA